MFHSLLGSAMLPAVVGHAAFADQTDVTFSLNDQIKAGGTAGIYKGGAGVMVRTPDFLVDGGTVAVPATFWVNDINTPSQLYPNGNPWCPHGKSDGYIPNIDFETCHDPQGPWEHATVAAVLGADGLSQVLPHFEDIQKDHYGWGVFYATDANSVDQRCFYDKTNKGWDCPGGWLDTNGRFNADGHKGSGHREPGNPDVGLGGGGAGCHFDKIKKTIDQVDAVFNNQNLVEDNCQCNYRAFNRDWNKWVQQWIAHSTQKSGFEWRRWLAGGQMAPAWGVDSAMCWVNNPRDMINLQNAMWDARGSWLNNMAPQRDQNSDTRYWGWNEVPVSRVLVDSPANWDAVMIKLPPMLCGGKQDSLRCLKGNYQTLLERDLGTWIRKNTLRTGVSAISQRPGSYIVLVKEYWNGLGYERQFYCENWTSPGRKYRIVFEAYMNGNNPGKCYFDNAHVLDNVVV